MRALYHPDPFTLERELIRRVAVLRDAAPEGPIWIVTPTRRLARHVQRRLAEERSAWLGVEVGTFRGLARRILESAMRPPLTAMSPRLLEPVLERALERLPDHPLSRFADERPGSRRSLLATLNELREAEVSPDHLHAAGEQPSDQTLAELYAGYVRELTRLETQGLTDEAGWIAAAADEAGSFARGITGVFLHGAYELVGMHLSLVRALSRETPVTALLPYDERSPAVAYARDYAARHLRAEPGAEALPDKPAGCLGPRLPLLFREDERGAPLDTVRFRHAQGAAREVEVALRHALVEIENGVAPRDIALIGRSLEPYLAAIEAQSLTLTTSLELPLRREPWIHDLLLLLRVCADDYPRGRTVELLRSPRLDTRALGAEDPLPGGLERWSRRARILGGRREWLEELTRWAERPTDRRRLGSRDEPDWLVRQGCRDAAQVIERLDRVVRPEALRRWHEHARSIELLLRRYLKLETDAEKAPGYGRLAEHLREMRALTQIAGSDPVTFREAVDWLEKTLDESRVPLGDEDGEGIRVLDAMQARGLTFRRVFILGFQQGLVPRVPREDPFLPDRLRRNLRNRGGFVLPLKLEGESEERQLLASMLAAAEERIDISWLRADEAGRANVPSFFLREVGRVALGEPSTEAVVRHAESVPAHPLRRLEGLAEAPGMLTPAEALQWIALSATDPTAAHEGLATRRPQLAAGLEMIRVTEQFEPGDMRYDGRLQQPIVRDRHSVSSLQELGRCPLRYFFGYVLGIEELEPEADAYTLPAQEIGLRVHETLEAVYKHLLEEGLDGDDLELRARTMLAAAWNDQMAVERERREDRLGFYWSSQSEIWLGVMEHFLLQDLARLKSGWTIEGLEQVIARELPLGNGESLTVHGRLDRVIGRDGEQIVGDYKTSGNLEGQTDPSQALKGLKLQAAIYQLLSQPDTEVELLGVAPYYERHPTRGDRASLQLDHATREGVRETLRVLSELLDRGSFPMARDDGPCRYCAYRPACRRAHPPTRERDDLAEDTADFRALKSKNTRRVRVLEKQV